ncbi:MAG: type III polyketide synthase [Polyangiaceae bacterium]
MTTAHINRIVTGVPPHDGHQAFVKFARTLLEEPRARAVFDRLAVKAQIGHRFSFLAPAANPEGDAIDAEGFYTRGKFPSTGERMKLYETFAPKLAVDTVMKLDLGTAAKTITHVITTSCTGMIAPGIDQDLIEQCGLSPSVERTNVGFMGCYAAINALKLARHIVRSEPKSRVLMVNLEMCSLHLQEAQSIEQLLSFLVFGDGCAASVVSADPRGLAIDSFFAAMVPGTRPLITWKIRDLGFDMFLSGKVPATIAAGVRAVASEILSGSTASEIDLWAVHPGGRSILDAVEHGLELAPTALNVSRDVLQRFGNMSSATVMFVLESILGSSKKGERGCAMSFGPGLTAETMLFHRV